MVINAIATTTSTPTMPAEIPLLSGVRTVCELTTSRLSFGVSTTTRLLLACSSSYAIDLPPLVSNQFLDSVPKQIVSIVCDNLCDVCRYKNPLRLRLPRRLLRVFRQPPRPHQHPTRFH